MRPQDHPVLIVDDSPVVRASLRDMLHALGYGQIHEAHDSQSGMAAFDAHRPRLVLLDITMPDAPGTRLAKQILSAEPTTRVVLVTAVSRDEELVESVIGFGAYDYIRKPVRLDDLEHLTERIAAEAAALAPRPEDRAAVDPVDPADSTAPTDPADPTDPAAGTRGPASPDQ